MTEAAEAVTEPKDTDPTELLNLQTAAAQHHADFLRTMPTNTVYEGGTMKQRPVAWALALADWMAATNERLDRLENSR